MKIRAKLTKIFMFAMAISLWSSPSLAGDPFRSTNTRDIGEKTQEAFEALFELGNYPQAKEYLTSVEPSELNDPLAYAMRASLAYLENDWGSLKINAQETLRTAENLKSKDPLRGNLYLAVGHFLEGTYIFETEDAFAALNKLPIVFEYFEAAEKTDPKDPEVNLIKGYLDLLLAVNLPFSNPEQAIERFSTNAAPDYLVYRGIALAYRDLDEYDSALEFVDKALQLTPDNPELYYLKGQILRKMNEKENDLATYQNALENYDRALAKSDQLPASVLKTLTRERNKTQEKIDQLTN